MSVSRLSFPGGSYCDSKPSGEYAVLFAGSHLQTHLGRIELPGEDVLFVRVGFWRTADGRLVFAITGQGHDSGVCWLWAEGAWTEHGPTNGVSPAIIDNDGNLLIVRPGPDVTSQGYRFADEHNRAWMGDETYADKDRQIWEYTTLAEVTIGQGESGCQVLL